MYVDWSLVICILTLVFCILCCIVCIVGFVCYIYKCVNSKKRTDTEQKIEKEKVVLNPNTKENRLQYDDIFHTRNLIDRIALVVKETDSYSYLSSRENIRYDLYILSFFISRMLATSVLGSQQKADKFDIDIQKSFVEKLGTTETLPEYFVEMYASRIDFYNRLAIKKDKITDIIEVLNNEFVEIIKYDISNPNEYQPFSENSAIIIMNIFIQIEIQSEVSSFLKSLLAAISPYLESLT